MMLGKVTELKITELMAEADIRAALKTAFAYTESKDEATKAAAYADLAYCLRKLVHAKREDIYHEEERIYERTKRGIVEPAIDSPPAPNAEYPSIQVPLRKAGEFYAGIILCDDGTPDYHLILVPGEAVNVTWDEARTWAESFGASLPTRRELSLLFANAKRQFQPTFYWSSEAFEFDLNSHHDWYQDFSDGIQLVSNNPNKFRARAVRRVPVDGGGHEQIKNRMDGRNLEPRHGLHQGQPRLQKLLRRARMAAPAATCSGLCRPALYRRAHA